MKKTLGDIHREDEKKNPKKGEELSQSGSTSGTSVMRKPRAEDILEAARASGSGPVENSICNITLYRNGLVVGDSGTFRSFDDPANEAFVKSLLAGEVPRELEAEIRGTTTSSDIGVNIINRSTEDYIKPFVAFSTAGFSLGKRRVFSWIIYLT
jgi:hypothetical protein